MEIFMDALENQPPKFLKRGHSTGDKRLEDSDTDSPDKKRQTNAASDLIKSIGTTNAEVEKFLNENGQTLDVAMKHLLRMMINQTNTCQMILEQQSQRAYGQPPSFLQWENDFTEHRHRRSVVITGLTEANFSVPSKRVAEDEKRVQEILDHCDIEVKPFAIFRMGVKGTKPRLLKVEFPSKSVVAKLMKRKSSLKSSDSYSRIFIRPSMNKTEREERRKLQEQCNLKNKENTDTDPSSTYVIYAGSVIRRRDITKSH